MSNSYICGETNNRIMIRTAIKNAMEAKGIRQQELADVLGVSKSSVSNYLAGRRKLKIENIEKALEFLGLEIVLKDR